MPATRCLVCDFGNVIGFFDHRIACRALARFSHAGLDPDSVYAMIFGTELEADYDAGRVSTDDFLRQLREDLALEATDADLRHAWCDIFTPNEQVTRFIHDLKARDVRLVLASNTNALHYGEFSRTFADTMAHFDERVLSFELGHRKPARRFFEACLQAARPFAPSECFYLDDRPDFVVQAQSLGMRGQVYSPEVDLWRVFAQA